MKNAWLKILSGSGEAQIKYVQISGLPPKIFWAFGTEGEDIDFKGYFQVLIEPAWSMTDDETIDVQEHIRNVLQAHRNLSEDFLGIEILSPEDIHLRILLDIADNADPDRLAIQIESEMAEAISPSITFYSLKERLVQGKTADEIFQGPALDNGFIDDEDLERFDKKTSLRYSDLLHRVMDVPGVKRVRHLSMIAFDKIPNYQEDRPDEVWETQYLKLTADKAPRLKSLKLTFHKGLKADDREPVIRPDKEKPQQTQINEAEKDLPIPEGKYRDLGRFFSITRDLPQNYGIGANGLPDAATPKRQAQARQLKGYIALFEQLLANYFEQLAHARELLALDYSGYATYFPGFVGASDGIMAYEGLLKDPAGYIENLKNEIESEEVRVGRHQNRLEHLLARFSETITDILEPSVNSGGVSIPDYESDPFEQKRRFLKAYGVLGRQRGSGLDYRDPSRLHDPENCAGLQKRIGLLLNMQAPTVFPHDALEVELYDETDLVPDGLVEYRFRVRLRATGKILLSGSTRYTENLDAAYHELRWALRQAANPDGYVFRKTNDNRWYFNVIYPDGEVVARRIEYFDTIEQCEYAASELYSLALGFPGEEYFYLVEHLLIRPKAYKNRETIFQRMWLPGLVSPPNPWSFQISFAFPSWVGRFANETNQQIIEELIDREAPAHLTPYERWLDTKSMPRFENAYFKWRRKRAHGWNTEREERILNEELGICQPVWIFKCRHLNTPTSRISLQCASIPGGSEITISFWAKFKSPARSEEAVPFFWAGNGAALRISFSTEKVSFLCGVLRGREDQVDARPSGFLTEWHHWAFTKNAATGEMAIYQNGDLLNSEGNHRIRIPRCMGTEKYNVFFGNEYQAQGNEFTSHLSDIRIWNAARSQWQIQDAMIFRFPTSAVGAGSETLQGYWKLDEKDTESTVYDSSMHKNDGKAEETVFDSNNTEPEPSWF